MAPNLANVSCRRAARLLAHAAPGKESSDDVLFIVAFLQEVVMCRPVSPPGSIYVFLQQPALLQGHLYNALDNVALLQVKGFDRG